MCSNSICLFCDWWEYYDCMTQMKSCDFVQNHKSMQYTFHDKMRISTYRIHIFISLSFSLNLSPSGLFQFLSQFFHWFWPHYLYYIHPISCSLPMHLCQGFLTYMNSGVTLSPYPGCLIMHQPTPPPLHTHPGSTYRVWCCSSGGGVIGSSLVGMRRSTTQRSVLSACIATHIHT